MAIYSLSISNVSRAKGGCSVATLAYHNRDSIQCDATKQSFDYSDRADLVASEFLEPSYSSFGSAEACFNALENYEKKANARVAKKMIVALPREFDSTLQIEVLRKYLNDNFVKNGYCVNYAIHNDPENHNPHAHILITNRAVNKKGEFAPKIKKVYATDEKGERIPIIDKKTGQQKIGERGRKMWKREKVESNMLDEKDFLLSLRENWSQECNKHLDNENQISHKAYHDKDSYWGSQNKIATIHEGWKARQIEKTTGAKSYKCEYNRVVKALNNDISTKYKSINQDKLYKLLGDLIKIRTKFFMNLGELQQAVNYETKTVPTTPKLDEFFTKFYDLIVASLDKIGTKKTKQDFVKEEQEKVKLEKHWQKQHEIYKEQCEIAKDNWNSKQQTQHQQHNRPNPTQER